MNRVTYTKIGFKFRKEVDLSPLECSSERSSIKPNFLTFSKRCNKNIKIIRLITDKKQNVVKDFNANLLNLNVRSSR